MKLVLIPLTILMVYGSSLYGQIKQNSFVRVFNTEGVKVAKGKIVSADEMSLTILNKKSKVVVDLKNIGVLKLDDLLDIIY